jgi:hypothetical protein
LSCFFLAVISAAGTVLETGNFAVDAQEVISAITPMIAKLLIDLIFLCYLISFLTLFKAFRIPPLNHIMLFYKKLVVVINANLPAFQMINNLRSVIIKFLKKN